MATGGNRNALNRQVGVDGQRDWSHDLFNCTDECCLCMSTHFSFILVDLIHPRRLLGRLVSLRGLFQDQTAPSTSAEPRHSSPG